MLIGFVIALIFGIKLLIIAFKESVLWGIGSLLVPFVSLIFIAMHWDKCKGAIPQVSHLHSILYSWSDPDARCRISLVRNFFKKPKPSFWMLRFFCLAP